jgi:hypothetical protein
MIQPFQGLENQIDVTQRSRWRVNAGLDDLILLGLNERGGDRFDFCFWFPKASQSFTLTPK